MLNDEKHLIVMHRLGKRLLRGQQLIQPQIPGVGQSILEIEHDAGFEGPLIFRGRMGVTHGGG